jgi:hypothetical protein
MTMSEQPITEIVKEKYGQAALHAPSGCCDPITSNLYDEGQKGDVPEKAMLASRDRTLALITNALKMDKETAADTYKVVQDSFNDTGIPTPEGIGNIIKAIKAEGRFVERNISFQEVAEPRFAIEVAKELGYKLP